MSDRSLRTRRVAITAQRRVDEQRHLFEQRGATVVHAPLLRCELLSDDPALLDATEALIARAPDLLIVPTGTALWAWLRAAHRAGLDSALRNALASTTVLARGPKAVAAARGAGLTVRSGSAPLGADLLIDGLIAELSSYPKDPQSTRVALLLDGSPASGHVDRLATIGVDVVPLSPYRWALPTDTGPAEALVGALAAGELDSVTFTTARAVEHLVAVATAAGLADDLASATRRSATVVGCVGSRAADTAFALGFDTVVVPSAPRVAAMVRVVSDALTTVPSADLPAMLTGLRAG